MWDLKKKEKREEDREHKIDTKSKWDIRYSEFEGKNREYYILERSERCSTLVFFLTCGSWLPSTNGYESNINEFLNLLGDDWVL